MTRMHLDVGSAEVYAPDVDEHPHRCRVFITDTHVQAWEDTDSGPCLFLDSLLAGPPPPRDRGTGPRQVTLSTDAGLVHVSRVGGGCCTRSALKALSTPVPW